MRLLEDHVLQELLGDGILLLDGEQRCDRYQVRVTLV